MPNYENTNTSEVKRLAKQGDKDALYEMAWRRELMPFPDTGNGVENCAWQDYWWEKAAEAGNIEAKGRLARSLINRIINADDRQKAHKYLESLVADYNAGKIDKDEGEIANLYLGILLCEGYHTWRDALRGAELIQTAYKLSNGFEGYGFGLLGKIAEIYGQGLAQPDEEPSIADLEKAMKYSDMAIERFNPEKNNPNILEEHRRYRSILPERISEKRLPNYQKIMPDEINERREQMKKPTSERARERMEADKAAFARLSQRLAREGW